MVLILPSMFLGLSNNWQKIWPIFGATNQLIGAIALLFVSTYLIGVGKPTVYTLVPAMFMIVTTIAAILYQVSNYLYSSTPNYTLGILASVLIILGTVVGYEGFGIILRNKMKQTL